MSREIRFRGFKDFGGNALYPPVQEWKHGSLVIYGDGTYWIKRDSVSSLVVTKTVGQYTGLKDKNGVEIYESDLLKSGADIIRVVWVNELASFGLTKSGWLHTHYFQEAINPSDCEVIGNIYQNPELLEG